MNQPLQGLQTIYFNLACYFSVVCNDKIVEFEKFFKDFVVGGKIHWILLRD